MSNAPTLSLVVIRVSNIAHSLEFYSSIGLEFECERHGTGPEHYAAAIGNTIFELYPLSERLPVSMLRLGFAVNSIDDVLSVMRGADIGCNLLSEPKESPWGFRAVVADPDGNRVELIQKVSAPTAAPQELLEVYSSDSNYAVIKPPGRQFPGAVIQGDSLSILCRTAQRIAKAVRNNKTDDEDFPGEVEDLLHELLGRLQHYQCVLQKYGIRLPFSRPVTDDDFIKLTVMNDGEP